MSSISMMWRNIVIGILLGLMLSGALGLLSWQLGIIKPSTTTLTTTRYDTLYHTIYSTTTRYSTETLHEFVTLVSTSYQMVGGGECAGYQTYGPLRLLNTYGFLNSWGGPNVYGEVENVGSQNLKYVKVGVVWFDSNSRIIDVDYGYCKLDILKPGEKAPFWLFGLTEDMAMKYSVFIIPSYDTVSVTPYRDFTFYGVSVDKVRGHIEVSGWCKNTGFLTVSNVEVILTLYDSQGRVVYATTLSTSPGTLGPGDSGYFEKTIYTNADIAHEYRLQAQGEG